MSGATESTGATEATGVTESVTAERGDPGAHAELALLPALLAINGAASGESMFGPGPGLWVSGKEVLHLDEPSTYDVRLTRAVIRELRTRLRADERVRLRRSSSSDWIEVVCVTVDDEQFLVELARRAVAAHLPPAGTASAPAPTGAELARRKRLH